jgi:hypothetical protein
MSSDFIRRKTSARGGLTPAEREKVEELLRLWASRGSRTIHHGRVKQTMLVLGPKVDFRHLVHSGDQEFAADLCEKMRKAQAKAPIPNGANVYTVVPLAVTSEEAGV